MTLPVSLTIPQFSADPSLILALGEAAPALGLTGLFVFDHLVPLDDLHRPVLEGACCLGATAASTTARVGSLVTRVTLRSPGQTAGLAAALAAIAPGRCVLGLGVGDRLSEEEARRYGMARPALAERLRLLAETIERVREAAPELPVWVGGRHPRVRALAARLADGWNGWGASPDELRVEADEVRALAERPFTVSWGGGLLIAPDQAALERAIAERGGAAGLVTGTPTSAAESLSSLAVIADELVVSVLPNRPDGWRLFADRVLPVL